MTRQRKILTLLAPVVFAAAFLVGRSGGGGGRAAVTIGQPAEAACYSFLLDPFYPCAWDNTFCDCVDAPADYQYCLSGCGWCLGTSFACGCTSTDCQGWGGGWGGDGGGGGGGGGGGY
jgi:hypothetical protein